MPALPYSIAVLVSTLVAAALGVALRRRIFAGKPDEAVSASITAALGLGSTLTAIVLGMVTASAKDTYDQANELVAGLAVDAITLDKILDNYGPETAPIRDALKKDVEFRINRLESPETYHLADLVAAAGVPRVEALWSKVAALTPASPVQDQLQFRALDMIGGRVGFGEGNMAQKRWLFTVRPVSIPMVFLAVVLGWLVLEFFCFGLFSKARTAFTLALVASSLIVASTMFLILELDDPIDGYFHVSAEPLRRALELLNM